jgi:single-strand DNA-binding protein
MTNTVLLIGNLGADPEARTTRGETRITTFSLGTSRPKRDSEGKILKDPQTGYTVKDTEWHRITCFNGLGKTVGEYATKGMLVSVRGRLHYSKWTDANQVERYGCEIIAEEVQFLSRGKASGTQQADLGLDEDVPF